MAKYRIIEKNFVHKDGKKYFVIEKKNIFYWRTLHYCYEEYINGELKRVDFETYESAEKYLIQKHLDLSMTSCIKSANVYELTHLAAFI